MTGECLRVLRAMEKGGHIEAWRAYPHAFHYWLVKADGNRYASDLSDATIDALVTGGFIAPGPPRDWRRDQFDYTITTAGEKAAKGEPTTPTHEQLVIPGTEAA